MSERGSGSAGQGGVPPNAVGLIRASNDAWHRRDIDAALAPYAEDVEWDTSDAWPDGRVYQGIDSLRAYVGEVLERWGEDAHRLDIEEILALEGGSSVLVHYRMSGRSRSGIPVDAHWVHVFEFRGEQIVRVRNFASLEAAVASLRGVRLARIWSSASE